MIGYKGLDKNFRCRDFQFKVGEIYTLDAKPVICEKGFHFCDIPLAVWEFYSPAYSRFALVEATGEIVSGDEDEHKFCTNKLTIIKELSLQELIDCANKLETTRNYSAASNTGDCSSASNTGYCSAASNTGDCSSASNTGYCSSASNTGYCSSASNTGNGSSASNTGDWSSASNTGYCSSASNTGDHSSASNTGDHSSASNTGNWSFVSNTGNGSSASNTGNYSSASNTGDWSVSTVSGKDSVAIVTGKGSKAKGSLGCWIVLTERDNAWHIVDVKAFKVDGGIIKPDTFYTLKNSTPVEVQAG